MTSNLFRDLRRKAGLTQAEAAERLGVTRVSVARYETGARIPEPVARLWQRICDEEGRRR
jgi:transcriptional regulator with XRE-family HTH domain